MFDAKKNRKKKESDLLLINSQNTSDLPKPKTKQKKKI